MPRSAINGQDGSDGDRGERRRAEANDFDTVFARYGTQVYRFCHRLCQNQTDAEDLTQEVFVAAFQGRDRFQGRAELSTWLYRIAVFRWRKMREDSRTLSLGDGRTHAAHTPDAAQAGLERALLDTAIKTLPDELREAFVLAKVEGLTCREAAQVLDIPLGTLKFRVCQAMRRLQAALQAEPEDTKPVPTPSRPAMSTTTGERYEV
jgi:RNA polymerase sigma-70 factor (ECF subfamily)